LRRGNFTGVKELIVAIKDYLAQNNKQPKPFVWTPTAQQIIDKVNRCKGISGDTTRLSPLTVNSAVPIIRIFPRFTQL